MPLTALQRKDLTTSRTTVAFSNGVPTTLGLSVRIPVKPALDHMKFIKGDQHQMCIS